MALSGILTTHVRMARAECDSSLVWNCGELTHDHCRTTVSIKNLLLCKDEILGLVMYLCEAHRLSSSVLDTPNRFSPSI